MTGGASPVAFFRNRDWVGARTKAMVKYYGYGQYFIERPKYIRDNQVVLQTRAPPEKHSIEVRLDSIIIKLTPTSAKFTTPLCKAGRIARSGQEK
jgi:hypothetical protein